MGFIYKLTYKVSTKAYIGQTTRPILERLKEHQQLNSKCKAISSAIKKHGWENFDKEWYEVPDEELNFYEEMLIALLGTLSPNGYNLMEGGGAIGKRSEETKQKMSKAQSGKTLSEEHKQKLSEANIGKTLSEETKKKMSKSTSGENHPMYGKTHSEESKRKMSEAQSGENHPLYGKTHTEETKKKISEALAGKTCTDEHKQKLREAHTGKTHTEETKRKISKARTGNTHTEESKKKMSEAKTGEKNPMSKRVYQYTLDGTYVDSFGSCGEAAQHLNKKSRSLISDCASGKCTLAHGFKWSYENM